MPDNACLFYSCQTVCPPPTQPPPPSFSIGTPLIDSHVDTDRSFVCSKGVQPYYRAMRLTTFLVCVLFDSPNKCGRAVHQRHSKEPCTRQNGAGEREEWIFYGDQRAFSDVARERWARFVTQLSIKGLKEFSFGALKGGGGVLAWAFAFSRYIRR